MPLGQGGKFDRSRVKVLFAYGGWVSVTNLVSTALSSLDRLVIGSVISAEAVAFYTVPSNLVNRLVILPGALSSSLFPKMSRGTESQRAQLSSDAVMALAAVMTPLIVAGMAALPVFLRHWVGASFAQHAVPTGIVLLGGAWINGLAYIPFAHLQASDRPDIVAKFHMIELLPFLALLWAGLYFFGLVGAAYACTLRVTIDTFLLFLASKILPDWHRLLPGVIFLVLAAIFAPKAAVSLKTGIEIGLLAVTLIWSWRLSSAVRSTVRGWIRIRAVA
jgi:O-antigen/teichoic acid export membrane protein